MDASPLIVTVGYGTSPVDELLRWLRSHGIGFLLDVRSSPYSRRNPDFGRDALRVRAESGGVRYAFFGDLLGGRPADPGCYVAGRVNYDAVRERPGFVRGIARVRAAWEGGHRVALLCACSRPERCHRSKLIGESLVRAGLPVLHRDEQGTLVDHRAVLARLGGGPDLFGGTSGTRGSTRQYRPS